MRIICWSSDLCSSDLIHVSPRLFPILMAPLLLAGCKPPPDERPFMPVADAAHGRAVIERVGCGSCHTVPGVGWPQGKVGPNLDGLTERALIAGKLRSEEDTTELQSLMRTSYAVHC